MIVIRKHQHGIALNPYEYLMNDGKIANFKDKDQALKYVNKKGTLDVETEEELWETYGIELHEIDKAQLAQISKEIQQNNGKS